MDGSIKIGDFGLVTAITRPAEGKGKRACLLVRLKLESCETCNIAYWQIRKLVYSNLHIVKKHTDPLAWAWGICSGDLGWGGGQWWQQLLSSFFSR